MYRLYLALLASLTAASFVCNCSINPIPTPGVDSAASGFDAGGGLPEPLDTHRPPSADTLASDAGSPEFDVLAEDIGSPADATADIRLDSEREPDGRVDIADPCDDGDPCTIDLEDPEEGCLHEPVFDGPDCPPGRCGEGCTSGWDCDDGDPCTVDSCLTFVEPSVCQCVPIEHCSCDPAAPDGGRAACDDGDVCTCDRCIPNDDPAIPWHVGLCTHEFQPNLTCDELCTRDEDCVDDDRCTMDYCELVTEGDECFDALSVCVHPLAPAPCGLPCAADDECESGDTGPPLVCSDEGVCVLSEASNE